MPTLGRVTLGSPFFLILNTLYQFPYLADPFITVMAVCWVLNNKIIDEPGKAARSGIQEQPGAAKNRAAHVQPPQATAGDGPEAAKTKQ